MRLRGFSEPDSEFLECEKRWIYLTLMAVGGYFGAYTIILRGGVFCNAQTANFVLMAVQLGQGNWWEAAYYLVPIFAYFAGAVLSEYLPAKIKKYHFLRWDTLLVGFELLVVIILCFLPDSLPVQVFQVAINFICSMQYNTFRQAQKIPMATTFCTNHLRQTGVYLVKWLKHRENRSYLARLLNHAEMLGAFLAGGVVSAFLCGLIGGRAIFGAGLLLLVIFIALLLADRTREKELLEKIPSGH